MQQTQATVETPIRCWCYTTHEWVDVQWTPPGQEWPKEKIEKIRLPPFMLKHFEDPDEEDFRVFRWYLRSAIQSRRTCSPSRVKYIDDRINFLSTWIKSHNWRRPTGESTSQSPLA